MSTKLDLEMNNLLYSVSEAKKAWKENDLNELIDALVIVTVDVRTAKRIAGKEKNG